MCTVRNSHSNIGPAQRRNLASAAFFGLLMLFGGAGLCQERPNAPLSTEPAVETKLQQITKICVGEFGNDVLGIQMKEIIIAKLFEAKRFKLKEDCKAAKAEEVTVKGSVTERTEHTFRSESEGISAGKQAVGVGASSSTVVAVGEGGSLSAHENLSSSQTKEHAVVTLRLVDKEGEILWAISQESTGGKTKGAIGDAAERAVRRLLRDIERAEKQPKPRQP